MLYVVQWLFIHPSLKFRRDHQIASPSSLVYYFRCGFTQQKDKGNGCLDCITLVYRLRFKTALVSPRLFDINGYSCQESCTKAANLSSNRRLFYAQQHAEQSRYVVISNLQTYCQLGNTLHVATYHCYVTGL